MRQLDAAAERGCGLEGCLRCAGRFCGDASAPRAAREHEFDPIAEALQAGMRWFHEAEPPSAADALGEGRASAAVGRGHSCRTKACMLLAALRDRFGAAET